MRLSELNTGEKCVVVKVFGHKSFRKRIVEMGFVRGQKIEVVFDAPLKDPVVYKLMDYEISLRRSEASLIEVVSEAEAYSIVQNPFNGTINEDKLIQIAREKRKKITVALVGNPNCGKSSLFNEVTNSHVHVGNYGGVTVDTKTSSFKQNGYTFDIADLPGTYSLSAYSPEEQYVRKYIVEQAPDIVINVIDASNLERNLYLTTQLIDMDMQVVIALNMFDEFTAKGNKLDIDLLSKLIGIPIVPTVARTGKGIKELFGVVADVYNKVNALDNLPNKNKNKNYPIHTRIKHTHINYGEEIEAVIDSIKKEIHANAELQTLYSTRYLSIKLLENDKETESIIAPLSNASNIFNIRNDAIKKIKEQYNEDAETAITNAKYGFVSGALKESFIENKTEKIQTTKIIDAFVTHKLWGFPIFLLIMWLMFEATFTLGAYPMGWIEGIMDTFSTWIGQNMPDGSLKDLITDGVIGGVGGVIVFLPNIMILYLFISFMEDSGYMARAAFIMDKLMHLIGLHGKSFIPLVMGFGCTVPSIMASRTIGNQSSRIITILINPFISCSARLPVYLLLVGVFFEKNAGLVLFGIYLFGIVMAIITAKLLQKLFFKHIDEDAPFIMELPPYRRPTTKTIFRHMWYKALQYLKKMGGIILFASIVIWTLSYFPKHENKFEQQKNSYIGKLGQFCEPVMQPIGFNWKISVSLISGAAAKELIVSTLGILYSGDRFEEEGDEENKKEMLTKDLLKVNPDTGTTDITQASSLSYLVFVLLCFPCIASLVAIKQETGSYRWMLFSIIYNTGLAWISAFVVYRIALMFL